MLKERKQYNNIDLFKIIFAVIVVMIHTTPFRDLSDSASWYFSNTIANLAVPFFFVTSGFLLFGKLANCDSDNHKESVKKYIFHIIRMYLIWCAIWVPWKALNFYNIGSFTLLDFLIYIKYVILISGGDALWYLPALAFAVLCYNHSNRNEHYSIKKSVIGRMKYAVICIDKCDIFKKSIP